MGDERWSGAVCGTIGAVGDPDLALCGQRFDVEADHWESSSIDRRRFLSVTALESAATLASPSRVLAAWREPTPAQPAWPFYAPFKPLSIDNDLVLIPGSHTPAAGTVIHLGGRVLDQIGRPVDGARVEI